MGSKKKKPANPMEDYIKSLITEQLKLQEEKIKKEDAEEIIKAIIPELEKLVAKIIKKHMKEIANYILDKVKKED